MRVTAILTILFEIAMSGNQLEIENADNQPSTSQTKNQNTKQKSHEAKKSSNSFYSCTRCFFGGNSIESDSSEYQYEHKDDDQVLSPLY